MLQALQIVGLALLVVAAPLTGVRGERAARDCAAELTRDSEEESASESVAMDDWIQTSKGLIERGRKLKLITGRQARSLRKASTELLQADAVDKEYTKALLSHWKQVLDHAQKALDEFEALPRQERKRHSENLSLLLSLSTNHLFAFLKAPSHHQWDLKRLANVLKVVAELDKGMPLTVKLFALKREVLRYFDPKEFRFCR